MSELQKQRIRDLYRFLREANQLRFRPVRRLNDQPRSLDLFSLPKHPSVQINRPIPSGDGAEVPDQLIGVRRPVITRCPSPPPKVCEWLVAGWDNPSKSVEYAESRNAIDENGEPVTELFDDNPERVGLYLDWLQVRDAWVPPEILARQAMAVFEFFYQVHSEIEKDGEQLELLVADGHLAWRTKSDNDGIVEINHPVLLKRVELRFDPNKPEFTVHETDREPELYGGLFVDLMNVQPASIKKRQDELSLSGYHPLGWEDTEAFLKAFIQSVAPLKGVFSREASAPGDTPQLWRAPVLILRKRVAGIANAIDAIIDDIEQQEVFPPALGEITGTAEGDWSVGGLGNEGGAGSRGSNDRDENDDILLAKESNEEQLQIIKRLSRSGSVIVQGPPGTGKTHTIGNIIGHLLAQGKSVLVTSHTTKALRVLRDKVPEMLQPLCVSVLGSDGDARKQLESSIASITERLTQGSASGLLTQAQRMTAERVKLLAKVRELNALRRTALENEYRELSVNGREYTPSDAARYVAQHKTARGWIPSPVKLGAALTLPAEDLIRAYALSTMFSVEDEHDASLPLPDLATLPSERQFEVMVDEYQALTMTDLSYGQERWIGAGTGSEAIATLCQVLAAEFSTEVRRQQWRPYAISSGIHGGTAREVWERIISKIEEACEAGARHSLVLHHQPRLSPEFSAARQRQLASEITAHLENGGKLGMLQLVTRSEWRSFIKTAKVTAGSPSQKDHFDAIHRLAHLEEVRQELGSLWDGIIGQSTGITFGSVGVSPEQACRALIPEMRRCLDWYAQSWLPLVEKLREEGFKFDDLAAAQPREPSPIAEYLLIEKLAVELLPQLLEKEAARRRLAECEQVFRALEELSMYADREHPDRGCIGRILVAVRYRNKEGYAAALAYARHIHTQKPLVEERAKLITQLRLVAPGWAEHLASRVPPHDAGQMPGDHVAAWTWRQLHDELAERDRLDVQEIQQQIDKARLTLRELTTSLIDASAWGNQMARLQGNNAVRQALVGWLDTAKRLISTRKADKRQLLLSESRKLMKQCAAAVPVWVMPISIMAESFDPRTTRFDVAIIDEASQADLNALIPLYMAKQIIIVGDHEQVTPLGVGKDQGSLENLRRSILQDIPNGHLYDNLSSIYDIGRQSFGDAIRLAEHFRCVPEIIAFSNQLSYQGGIRPLRETNSSILKPACVPCRVQGVREGMSNTAEAEAIVGLIEAMIKHPAYARKTIGVISMVGEAQAVKIETLLLKRIESVEIQNRRIQAGVSAQFQGDERDVMFLSLVDSQDDEVFLRSMGDGAFESMKKRFNVATSRARDQLWVMHSFDPDRHLKAGDMRLQLLQHMKNPWAAVDAYSNEEKKADSDFERQVMKRLVDAGYRVRAQWQVGYYRIDLVVEGDGKRLAIECDGDRYHPLDKLEDDIARQTVLERLGWQFVRIRGSAFYRSQIEAMRPVFDKLEELGIPAVGQVAEERRDDWTLIHELEEMVRARKLDDDAEAEAATDPVQGDEQKGRQEERVIRVISEIMSRKTVDPEPTEFPSPSLDQILRTRGRSMQIEKFTRVWAVARGYQRVGRQVREQFDLELATHIEQGTVIVAADHVILT
jgi:very-short-patch-repair endonuclease